MVTGATSGIGLATAKALARLGAELIAVGRNPEKGARVVEELIRETGNRNIGFMPADLSDMRQVRELANSFIERYPRLDVLINNAAGFYMKRRETAEGIEMTLALNLLCPFLLSNLLLAPLRSSRGGRIINVASDAHRGAQLNFDDMEGRRRYSGFRAYSRSKLGLVLFTYELARRIEEAPAVLEETSDHQEASPVCVNAVHPGFTATNFGVSDSWMMKVAAPIMRLIGAKPEEGADTAVYLATASEMEGTTGKYFIKREAVKSSPITYDVALARRLWYYCAEITGI
jgi:NAD(P)-dependent dehydrogenase (short-subunit alcohol dehydrogenase family)